MGGEAFEKRISRPIKQKSLKQTLFTIVFFSLSNKSVYIVLPMTSKPKQFPPLFSKQSEKPLHRFMRKQESPMGILTGHSDPPHP